MLAYLLNVPSTAHDWGVFSWAHRDQHKQVLQKIQIDTGTNLTEYVIDPIAFDNFQDFLAANQKYHNDANGVLGTQGSDLTQLDPSDQNQMKAWAFLHYQEHFTWANILHIG